VDELEQRILDHEICLLANEVTKNTFRVDEDTPRGLMARAQAVMVQVMMEHLMDLEDWEDFEDGVWENVDRQKAFYRDSRASDDRQMAQVALARVRILTRLLNRLNNLKRHRLIALSFAPVPEGGSPPPLALRQLRAELERQGEW
jgi:hypothetical protein